MMRFREEYAVEWLTEEAKLKTSSPTSDRAAAEYGVDQLYRHDACLFARVVQRTVREEKRWWHLTWEITGITRWFDGSFDSVDVN